MAQNSGELTVIGRDTRIKGEMYFESGARILGSFEGKISSSGEVAIGSGANCEACIEANRVTVDGNITGNITAGELLTLNADAHVQGDIAAGKLIVSEGATFIGHCRVGAGASQAETEGRAAQVTSNGSTSARSTINPGTELKPTGTSPRPPRELELTPEAA